MKKERRKYIKLDQTVMLGKAVVISDPCYTLGGMGQIILHNVKPGEYVIEFYQAYDNFDGHAYCLTHKDYKAGMSPKETSNNLLDIDAGMVGVFPLEDYRNDSIVPDNHVYKLNPKNFNSPGDKWYCAVTPDWDKVQFRIVGNCFNSTSGYGDGCASLNTSTNSKGEVYRIAVRF